MTASTMPSILQKIIAVKQREIASRQQSNPIELIERAIAELAEPPREFYQRLFDKASQQHNTVIAEIKKASPSKGVLREHFDPQAIAKNYEEYGAACLSVITDETFFQGSETYLNDARNATHLPVIRKDFIIDAYQIFEARAMGADCILLIASCLSHQQMLSLATLAHELGMDVVVEVHNQAEIDKSMDLPIRMLGINNRNLHTFDVDLQTSIRLARQIPKDYLVITESGISDSEDVKAMNAAGIYSFLVGEAFMRCDNPGKKLQTLFHELPA